MRRRPQSRRSGSETGRGRTARDSRPPGRRPRGRGCARWFVLNNEFHHEPCDLSGHPVAWTLIRRVNSHLDRIRLPQPRYLDQALGEHRLILKAIARGDPDAAEDAMRHHLRIVLTALPLLRVSYPDYFATETT